MLLSYLVNLTHIHTAELKKCNSSGSSNISGSEWSLRYNTWRRF